MLSYLALSDVETSAILLSLKVAGVAVLVALPLALLVAFLLARYKFPGRTALNVLVLLPLVVPPVVTGYLLLIAFGRQGFIGKFLFETFDFSFAFQWTGAALAAGVMAFPLMVRPIRQAIEAVNRDWEVTARTLGAGRLTVFFTIIFPLALPGLIAALILGFAKALGEFGATITFVSNIPDETRTLPLAIYSLLQSPGDEGGLWRLTIFSILLAVGAVVLSEVMAQRLKRLSGESDA
ncbi:MAG: molybdate ABC transporter permease subunit [Hyphomicrobiales bacterium]